MKIIKEFIGYVPVYSENVQVAKNDKDGVIVRGLLLPRDYISRNGVLYDWDSQKQNVHKLKNCSFLYNHLNEGKEEPIGHFTDGVCLEKRPVGTKWEAVWDSVAEENDGTEIPGMYYEADLDPDDNRTKKITRGDLKKVSIQVMASESKQEQTEDGKSYTRAYISDILEGSAVPTPGFTQTNIEVAIAEAFKAKEMGQTTGTNPGAYTKKIPKKDELEKESEGDKEYEMFGEFPMDAFHIGLAAEIKEHPNLDAIEVGKLVLDHLSETPDYYHTEAFIQECLQIEHIDKMLEEKYNE